MSIKRELKLRLQCGCPPMCVGKHVMLSRGVFTKVDPIATTVSQISGVVIFELIILKKESLDSGTLNDYFAYVLR